ncbi:MAG: cytidylate kinase family protein [Dehalococcoidia bacterium]|nr:cytidylate kinase family protein [Dehalococcoidia bacterium]
MNTRVISISRQVGTAGEEVAQAVAKKLGLRFIDYQVIQRAAEEAGVSPETVSEAEHTPSLMTRILEALARNPSMPVAAWADPVPLAASPLFTSADYRKFVEDVIRDLADQGDCVIVGHAAQVILRDRFDTVRVLVTGSAPARMRRIRAGMGVEEKDALKIIERTDNERLDYFRRFYETGWLTPSTYDLCISTDYLTPAQCAEVIARFAELR